MWMATSGPRLRRRIIVDHLGVTRAEWSLHDPEADARRQRAKKAARRAAGLARQRAEHDAAVARRRALAFAAEARRNDRVERARAGAALAADAALLRALIDRISREP